MNLFKRKDGFTLVEVLISIALFAVIAVLSSNILVDIVQLEKKTSVQNAIYEDLRIILQQLIDEIQKGTIDYEEYYNYYVIQEGHKGNEVFYGINYGVYGSRFFDPGKTLKETATKNPNDLGAECSWPDPMLDECEIIYTLSLDYNTGQNPFHGDPYVSNAFCDKNKGKCDGTAGESDHLFLLDSTGTKKTIISRKLINSAGEDSDYAIGLIRMEGIDIDQNGIVDSFRCFDEFDCEDDPTVLVKKIQLPFLNLQQIISDNLLSSPQRSDLETEFDIENTQFVPISPLRSNVLDLKFIINPLDDPYKSFAEPDTQVHPSVTIIITLGLTQEAEEDYPGTFNPITIQTTVSAGVIGKIDSYPPVNEIRDKDVDIESWIKDVLPNELITPY